MIRYGIIGFGHHAIKRMLPGFAGAHNSKLTCMWRRNPEKGRENAKEFSVPFFETQEALYASPDIDAVFIASPDALHLPDILLAAKHGKHILCEKPLAMNTAEVEQMIAATDKAGVKLGVAQNMRYYRSLDLIRQWINEGRIGKALVAHSQFSYSAERSPREWIYDPALACGGPIGDVGVHCIDSLRYVLDTDVASVSTEAHGDAESGQVESYAALALTLTSGAVAAVTVTTRASYRSYVEVTGENAIILCENALTVDHPVEVILRKGEKVLASETVSNNDAYSLMLDGFTGWVEGKGSYLSPATDGLRNQKILDAAYASWRNGKRETIS